MRSAASLAAAAALVASGARAAPPVPSQVMAAMDAADAYFTGNNAQGDCGWTRGTYYAGAMAHYLTTCANSPSGCNATLLAWVTQWAESHNYSCGGSINANDEACGQAYIDLYRLAPSPEKLNLSNTLQVQIRNNDTSDWNWVDAVFMALPTWSRFGNVTGDFSYWEESFQLYLFTAYQDPAGKGPGLWSPEHNLFFRDATYFNKTSPNGAPVFWSRGNGWAIAAMARSIAELPRTHPYSVEYQTKLQKLAASLKAIQGPDGLWRANLLDADDFPNPETTGSAMFTYAIAWGVNNDLLVRSEYEAVVEAAWTGLSTISLQPNGLVGWCQPPNGQPAPATQTDTSDFCVGQFLLAGSEVIKMYGGK